MNATVETRDLVSSKGSGSEPLAGALAVYSSGKALCAQIPLEERCVVLGRDDERGIDDDRVSRKHATLTLDRGTWSVTDEDSRNGTFVNGSRITGRVTIEPPRVLRLAYTIYLVADDLRPYDGGVSVDGDRVIGPKLATAFESARRAASDMLLIAGESGVGKELAAREFHAAGGKGPFIAVNCAAIPEGVAERLLFGSVRGAYSGAVDADGYIAEADGGVLFLDEIGELEPAVQAKLLRVIETREVAPLGAARGRQVSTRFCFATFRNLRTAVAEQEFRADLFYRIARSEVRIPALRERREEIPWLIAHELAPRGLTAHARFVEECLLRPWPGNVRELRACVLAAARRAEKGIVRAEHLDATAGQALEAEASAKPTDVTREQVTAALAQHDGNVSAAARDLKLHRSQMYRLLDKYGLR